MLSRMLKRSRNDEPLPILPKLHRMGASHTDWDKVTTPSSSLTRVENPLLILFGPKVLAYVGSNLVPNLFITSASKSPESSNIQLLTSLPRLYQIWVESPMPHFETFVELYCTPDPLWSRNVAVKWSGEFFRNSSSAEVRFYFCKSALF